jgi:hypothetical protein
MPQPVADTVRKQVCQLALTDPERRDLMRLMYRVLDEIEIIRTDSYKDGSDIPEQALLDERAARNFLFLARLK